MAMGDSLRIASFHTDLSRDGPGLLLRDIGRGAPDVEAAVATILRAQPDVLLLLDFDWDFAGQALAAFAARLTDAGAPYPYSFTARPNSGMPSGFDLDRDGRLGGPRDAWGYGEFEGQGGMAVLSRLPLGDAHDFSDFLWKDAAHAQLPRVGNAPYYSDEVLAEFPLSSVGHWVVPFTLPEGGRADLLAFHATTPVFDGPEDRNGLRNRAEVLFWRSYLDGALGATPAPTPSARFVLAGSANLDPHDGDGDRAAIVALLADPRLQDPQPRGQAPDPRGVNATHRGDPRLDTARFSDRGPGDLRVDYVLPSADWSVQDAGLVWPAPLDATSRVGRHALVWVDIGG